MRILPPKIVNFLFLLIFFCIFWATVFGEQLPVKVYTSADGLGSSFVDYLMRDSRGFMWFCTRDGLSRFDGSQFVTYQIGDKNSLPGIQIIKETKDGMYWLMTSAGTYRFNPNEIIQLEKGSPRLNAEFIINRSGQFLEDSKGNIWLSAGGLSQLKQVDGKFTMEPFPLNLKTKSKDGLVIVDIEEAPDGSIWLNSNYGIVRILPDHRIIYYPVEVPINAGNNTLKIDKSGKVWIAIAEKLLVIQPELPDFFAEAAQYLEKSSKPTSKFELKLNETFQLPEKAGEILEFTGATINSVLDKSFGKEIFQSSDGTVWITAGNHLLEFANDTFNLHSDKEGLPNVMSRIEEDVAGNLWIGSRAGLARIDRNGLKTYRQPDGANSSRFFAINEARDGSLYFASSNFYLNRFENERFTSIRPQIPEGADSLWTSKFSFQDSQKGWWFLTADRLFHFADIANFEQLKTKPPTDIFSAESGLVSNGIFQIFESSKGDIWVSMRDETGGNGTGIARLKRGEKRFYSFNEADGLPKGKSFSAAVEDKNGNIWFSFYNGGLARFVNDKFEVWSDKDIFGGGVLPDLHLDKKGGLWIATSINGLFRLDDLTAINSDYFKYTTANGLSSNNIRTITEDNFGRIYVGTARGVDRIAPESGQIKHYTVNDGLAADFVVDSHCDKTGKLWFVTNNGISELKALPDEKNSAPRILIGGLTIAGEPQSVAQLGSTELEKGELSSNQNNLQIDFFGLDFRAGENLRYQYKLEGADSDWSQPTEQRTQTFANLSPGTYRFLVRAVNSEGLTSENPAIFSFKILSPIWQRWWFIALSLLFFGSIFFAFYRYRLARLQEINKALEEARLAEENLRKSQEERLIELEKVRSRIATDLHDDIGASLTQIAILSEVAQAQSKNGASEPLTKITDVSNELVGTMSDIVWSITPSKDHLSDLIQRMRRFASDSLTAKGISFHFNSPPIDEDITLGTNTRREFYLVFKEAINNILKHSDAEKVEIEVKINGQNLELEIADDGIGFETAKNFENSLSSVQMGGNGVLSMEKRAREMNGGLEIISAIGKGTKIILKLPLELKNNLHTTQAGGEVILK